MVHLLIKQLCAVVPPEETALVQNTCKLLSSLIENNVQVQEEIFTCSREWILNVLESALPIVHNDILLALKSILINQKFDVNRVIIASLFNISLQYFMFYCGNLKSYQFIGWKIIYICST